MTWFLRFGGIVALAAMVACFVYVSFADGGRASCVSPCTVVFPTGTQEDDWQIDYTHEDENPVLRVSVGQT